MKALATNSGACLVPPFSTLSSGAPPALTPKPFDSVSVAPGDGQGCVEPTGALFVPQTHRLPEGRLPLADGSRVLGLMLLLENQKNEARACQERVLSRPQPAPNPVLSFAHGQRASSVSDARAVW